MNENAVIIPSFSQVDCGVLSWETELRSLVSCSISAVSANIVPAQPRVSRKEHALCCPSFDSGHHDLERTNNLEIAEGRSETLYWVWIMLYRQAKYLVLTVTILSLLVSAVSACACSHHEKVKVEAESCHSSSHEVPAAEQPSGSTQFESDCNCFTRTPVPAIVAKKDDKRASVEEQIADIVELHFPIAIEFEIAAASDNRFEPPHSNYQHALLASLPSRAPPRL